MRAGQLRHQVVIEQPTTSSDGYGDEIAGWTTFATVWASVEPIRGKEYFMAKDASQEESHQVTHRVRIRYLSGVLPTMRITWGSRAFDIHAVLNTDERDIEMELLCTENL